MAGNLKSRLSRIRQGTGEKTRAGAVREPPIPPGDWTKAGVCLWERALEFPTGLPERVDLRPLSGRDDFPSSTETSRLLFFDLETTGLSGGTGTVAFLSAFGRVEGRTLRVTQRFMSDYPGEPGFLEAALASRGPEDVLVSYNGRSFDEPLLRTRAVMNGMRLARGPHLDLLYPARRLWKRLLPDCSLGTVESGLLGVERGEDVPGSEVPDIWFDYVKRGETGKLGLVFSHNARDVATLGSMLEAMAALVAGRGSFRADPTALAGLVARVDAERALALLRREVERARSEGDEDVGRAAWAYYRLARRHGTEEDRRRGLELLPDDLEGTVERAKRAEWRDRDLPKALAFATRASELAGGGDAGTADAEAASARLARLRRKLEARATGPR